MLQARSFLLATSGAMVIAGAGGASGCSNSSSGSHANDTSADGGGASSSSGGGSASSSGGGSSGGATSSSSGGGTNTAGGIFTQPEPWTKDVSALSKATSSDAIIAALVASGGWGGGKIQIDFSIPLFFAGASTPQQKITAPSGGYCYGGPDCDPVPLTMPLPANGNIEGSTNYVCNTSQNDCHLLVVDTGSQKLYELYNSTQSGTAFTALGAFVWDLTKAYPDNERGDQCTSADAAGFPIAGLLPTADEVAAGTVHHAVRFILPNSRMKKGVYVHPASHAGGPSSTNANAPPYGVRFRLSASFDETPFKAGEKVILQAMKTYGMLLSDGGTIALTFADDRTTNAKWAGQGITAQSFAALTPNDFEVVDLGADVSVTNNCVRNP
ncbi:MAG: hypothetical protein ACRENE_18400 [Polyangiaceae bacterium]